MDSFRLCWQTTPGGRTECTVPMSQDIALFHRRELTMSLPAMRSWITEEMPADHQPRDNDE